MRHLPPPRIRKPAPPAGQGDLFTGPPAAAPVAPAQVQSASAKPPSFAPRLAPPPRRPPPRLPSPAARPVQRPVETQASTASPTQAQARPKSGLAALRSSAPVEDEYDDARPPSQELDEAPRPVRKEQDTELTEIKVKVIAVLHRAADGFTVLKVQKGRETFSMSSKCPFEVEPEDMITGRGQWGSHKGWRTFKAELVMQHAPETKNGIVTWLKSRAVLGVGHRSALKLVSHFGDDAKNVMDQPDRLVEAGIDRQKAEAIAEAWVKNAMQPELVVFLGDLGLGAGMIRRVLEAYGSTVRVQIKENPWRMAERIRGMAFKTADDIAKRFGHPLDSPARICAAMRSVLITAIQSEGHCGLPVETMIEKAARLAGLSEKLVAQHVDEALDGKSAVFDEVTGLAISVGVLEREQSLSKHLARLLAHDGLDADAAADAIAAAEADLGIELDPSQRDAAMMALTNKVCVITGGPGTGKSTTQKVIVHALATFERKVCLAAPTGRASKRLQEVSGRDASTCHRLLQWQEGRFVHDVNNQMNDNWFIVDEFSMVDLSLAHSFVQAIASDSGLTIVGDVDQLPSVGEGQVLRDLIRSGVIPTSRLNVVHRQSNDSPIPTAASRINQGLPPLEAGVSRVDGFSIENVAEPSQLIKRVVDLFTRQLPAMGYDPMKDIQVLAPMRRHDCGVDALNNAIKAVVNPAIEGDGRTANFGIRQFTVGDRVMHTRNDYIKGVFNGEIGIVGFVGTKEDDNGKSHQFMRVDYQDFSANYNATDCDDLEMAYATTVHKSQGCEFPVVIMACHRSQSNMLKRNLLYTGVTRAKKICTLVGTPETIRNAAAAADTSSRYTGLAQRLKAEMELVLEPASYAPTPGGFIQIDEP